jgi:hypothetical protein
MPLLLLGLLGVGGWLGYKEWQKLHTHSAAPAWLPPIPALTKTYNDYRDVQTPPDMPPVVVWNLTTNQPITLGPGMSATVSDQENADSGFGPGSMLTGGLFWMNINGTANRMYTPVSL